MTAILLRSAVSSAEILVLVGFASVFGWVLASERIPQTIATDALQVTNNKFAVFLLINLLLLVVGMFTETIATLIIRQWSSASRSLVVRARHAPDPVPDERHHNRYGDGRDHWL